MQKWQLLCFSFAFIHSFIHSFNFVVLSNEPHHEQKFLKSNHSATFLNSSSTACKVNKLRYNWLWISYLFCIYVWLSSNRNLTGRTEIRDSPIHQYLHSFSVSTPSLLLNKMTTRGHCGKNTLRMPWPVTRTLRFLWPADIQHEDKVRRDMGQIRHRYYEWDVMTSRTCFSCKGPGCGNGFLSSEIKVTWEEQGLELD